VAGKSSVHAVPNIGDTDGSLTFFFITLYPPLSIAADTSFMNATHSHHTTGATRSRAREYGDEIIASQSFNSADLGLTLGRATSTPGTVAGLIRGLIDNVATWDRLARSTRDDGGEITATARTASRYASLLVDSHNADATAVRYAVLSRFGSRVLTIDGNAVALPDYRDADGDVSAELVHAAFYPIADGDAGDDGDADGDADA